MVERKGFDGTMKSGDGVPVDDGATAVSGSSSSSSSSNVDVTQVPVVGHVMESMPGCYDVIADEQVSESSPGQR